MAEVSRVLEATVLVALFWHGTSAHPQTSSSGPTIHFTMNNKYILGKSATIHLGIPADIFEIGSRVPDGGVDGSTLIEVTWPDWHSEKNIMPDSGWLQILLDPANRSLTRAQEAEWILKKFYTLNIDAKLDYHGMSLKNPDPSSNGLPNPIGHGIKQITNKNGIYLDKNDNDFFVFGSGENTTVLTCHTSTVVFPHCEEDFMYRDMSVQVTYSRQHVHEWHDIEASVKAHIDTWLKDATPKKEK